MARPGDLAAVVAGLGPGPFTGLRVGLVTAAVLGQTLAIPTYGVCSLDGIGAATTGSVLVATDARRKEVYWAVYRDGVRIDGPAVDRAGRPRELLDGGLDAAVGDGRAAVRDVLGLPVLDEPRYPSPLALAALAATGSGPGEPAELLTPLYLRRPDAVEPAPAEGRCCDVHALTRLRWWQIDELLPIENDLFGVEQWSAGMFWNELAAGTTTWWRSRATRSSGTPGSWSPRRTRPGSTTWRSAGTTSGAGIGRALLEELLDIAAAPRGRGRRCWRWRPTTRPAQALYDRVRLRGDRRCARATTRPARPTRW